MPSGLFLKKDLLDLVDVLCEQIPQHCWVALPFGNTHTLANKESKDIGLASFILFHCGAILRSVSYTHLIFIDAVIAQMRSSFRASSPRYRPKVAEKLSEEAMSGFPVTMLNFDIP